jgi:type IV pilus assembly protein PilY1
MKQKIFKRTLLSTLIVSALYGSIAQAALLSLATQPLYLSTTVAPNLIVILDDSGSMQSGFVPDSLSSDINTKRYKSAIYNTLYYNPNTFYKPPVNGSGIPYTTTFTSAYINGFATGNGSVNLSSAYRPTNMYDPSNTSQSYGNNPTSDFPGKSSSGVQAYYYVKDYALATCTSSLANDNCYRVVKVSATSGSASGPVGVDERQNFANWYSFYRTRNLAIISGASLAFQNLSPNVRVAWNGLTTCTAFDIYCNGWDGVDMDSRIRPFTGSHKTDFYHWLQYFPASSNTPLRTALARAGEYYKTSGVNSPYATDPQVSVGTESACRQNFTTLMTDGLWNDSVTGYGNLDNTAKTLPDGVSFSAGDHPFTDSSSNTLADIAFKYWSTDLRTDLANSVSPYFADYTGTTADQYTNPKNDPATWQHMVTFTVGLGLSTTLPGIGLTWGGDTYNGSYSDLVNGTKNWPAATSSSANNVADLWHAAINSRGQFFAADKPNDILNAFQVVISRVNQGVGSSAGVSANTTNIKTGTYLYQARFDSSGWSGDLLEIPVNANGSLSTNLVSSAIWSANTAVTAQTPTNRVMLTMKASSGKGIPFRWPATVATPTINELDVAQTNALQINPDTSASDGNGSLRLNFLRGDRSQENVIFKSRNGVLGDIVDSTPIIVEPPANFSADSTYNAFKTAQKTRMNVVYVGANDGFLHGFRASDGKEILAYAPTSSISSMNKLTSTNYVHQYFVNGSPNATDVKYSDNTWHTILASGMGSGGKGIFALDVTNNNFTESNAANIVKFEFNSANDSDVGYIQGPPAIVKANNGKWVAIFSNGYNSGGTGQSALFIVDIETGTLVKKILTGTGNTTTPNALATPTPIDKDGNGTIDYVYAGDLYGKMWKFDLSSSNPVNWKVALSGLPLFNTGGKPITSQADVAPSPNGGFMVEFGTGKYLESTDSADLVSYGFYGIWDNEVNSVLSNELVLQTVTGTNVYNGTPYRVTSGTKVNYPTQKGWYLALPIPGERVVTNPLVNGGKVIFTTLIPSGSSCASGGKSWVMELDYVNGSALTYQIFDTTNNGSINASDQIVSGMSLGAVASSPTILNGLGTSNSPLDRLIINQSDGTISSSLQVGNRLTSRRTSWREVIKNQ